MTRLRGLRRMSKIPFWRLRFLSVTVVVCLLSLTWLQASPEQEGGAHVPARGLPRSTTKHGQPDRQFWTQPRPPEDQEAEQDPYRNSFRRSLAGLGGRRSLTARHGINRLRKVASMGKQWMQLHR